MVRKPFLNNFHVFVLLAALVFFVDVSLTEDKLTADNVFSNKSSVPATSITCDAIPTLPSNETFCVCRLSDSQALIDLRGLAWTLSDPQRKGPRFVTGDDPKYSGWLAGWSPCSSFSLYTDNPLRTWAACWNAGFARFDNNSKYCQEEWSHVTSDFRVDANTRAVYLRFKNKNGKVSIEIKLVCDRSKEAASPAFHFLKYNREHDYKVYKLQSPCCCENGCTGAPQPPTSDPPDPLNYGVIGGIVGGVFVGILLLVLVVVAAVRWCRRPGPGNQPQEGDDHPPLLGGARAEPVEA